VRESEIKSAFTLEGGIEQGRATASVQHHYCRAPALHVLYLPSPAFSSTGSRYWASFRGTSLSVLGIFTLCLLQSTAAATVECPAPPVEEDQVARPSLVARISAPSVCPFLTQLG
jgi:hypothetical protein